MPIVSRRVLNEVEGIGHIIDILIWKADGAIILKRAQILDRIEKKLPFHDLP